MLINIQRNFDYFENYFETLRLRLFTAFFKL